MKKVLAVLLAASLGLCIAGCAKKQSATEEMDQLSFETLSSVNTTTPAPQMKPEVSLDETAAVKPQLASNEAVNLEPLPPAVSKPTAKDIQTALKNAGYYTGAVDGKVGPMTRKATEDFQKANNLEADGKVGPKTWGVLGSYLNQESASKPKSKKKR